jgi:hypothetical protein
MNNLNWSFQHFFPVEYNNFNIEINDLNTELVNFEERIRETYNNRNNTLNENILMEYDNELNNLYNVCDDFYNYMYERYRYLYFNSENFPIRSANASVVPDANVEVLPDTFEEGGNIQYVLKGKGLNVGKIKSFIQNGYKKKDQSKNIDGYERDGKLSGQRVQVYHNKDNNHVVINHRGTASINDVLTDLGLVFGLKNNKRFQHSKTITEKTKQKYGNADYTHISHSLGYQLGKEANKDKDEHITLNPALTHHDILDSDNNEKVIKSKIDPVSALHSLQAFKSKKNTIIIPNKTNHPIKEHGTQILDRLNQDMEI